MSDGFSDSESESNFDIVENEPMFAVLSQFLVTNKNKNIAQVMADLVCELSQIKVALNKIADIKTNNTSTNNTSNNTS